MPLHRARGFAWKPLCGGLRGRGAYRDDTRVVPERPENGGVAGREVTDENRVGVDRTEGQAFPTEFVAVLPEQELKDETPTRAIHNSVPILLIRRGEHIFALAETCSHFSGPLAEGKLVGNSIVCPYHFSRFSLEDGRVLDGPAVHPQPCLEARIRNAQIEVRRPVERIG